MNRVKDIILLMVKHQKLIVEGRKDPLIKDTIVEFFDKDKDRVLSKMEQNFELFRNALSYYMFIILKETDQSKLKEITDDISEMYVEEFYDIVKRDIKIKQVLDNDMLNINL